MMKIPNIFHFCYFGGRQFDLVNYLTIRSANDVNHPEKMYIYLDVEPEGDWWEKSKPFLTIEKIEPPNEIAGKPLKTAAHKANIVRLLKLLERGGIYLDTDVICRNPFTPLLDKVFVLGREEMYGKLVGLCNAVILSEPNALFAQRWLEGFYPETSYWKGYRSDGNDKYFTEFGVKYPNFLSTIFAEEIHIEPSASFYYPNYTNEQVVEFFETDSKGFDGSYCHHLWARAFYEKYLHNMSMAEIKSKNTAFSRLAQQFLD